MKQEFTDFKVDIEKILDEKLNANYNKLITSFESMITTHINNCNVTFEARIRSVAEDLVNTFNFQLSERDETIKSLETKLAETQQQHEEFKVIEHKKCNVVVNGIPYQEDESIPIIFKTITSQLGFSSPPNATVYRMPGVNGAARPIIVKLESDLQVDQLMSRYYKVSKQLKLDAFDGFVGNKTRIYISEDLTSNQYNIFKQAMIFLKSKDILNIRKKSGFVLVQINKGTRHRSYNSVDELKAEVNHYKETNNF